MKTTSNPSALILGAFVAVVGIHSLAYAALSTPFLVKDINGTNSFGPDQLTDVNGTLFFGVAGDLWKSDGTESGTVLVEDLPGSPILLKVSEGTLFFIPQGLRVRPRRLRGIAEFSYHQANRRQVDECRCLANPLLNVLRQATAAIEPRECPFNDPAFGEGDKAFDLVTSCDNLYDQLGADVGHALTKLRPLIRPIREQFGQQRKALGQGREQLNPAVPVLNVRRMHDRLQNQPQGIPYHVALVPFDLFARIKP